MHTQKALPSPRWADSLVPFMQERGTVSSVSVACHSVAATRLESGPQAGAGRFCKSADRADLSHQLASSRDCKSTQTAHPLASTASEFPLPACVLSMP